mgnify:CR=1 FL=1
MTFHVAVVCKSMPSAREGLDVCLSSIIVVCGGGGGPPRQPGRKSRLVCFF